MNAVTPIRARPIARLDYQAWASAGERPVWQIELHGTTLAEIERDIARSGLFGETIFVLETDHLKPSQTVHAYRIRRGKWQFQVDPHTANKVYPYKADKLFALPVHAFEPVERFRATPGSDALGLGMPVIEAA